MIGRPTILLFGRLIISIAALASLSPQASRADKVPGIGTWSHYYYTLDSKPVSVVFVHKLVKRDYPVLTIPCSYIYIFDEDTAKTTGKIPDQLEARYIAIAFTEPDGDAWSTSLNKYQVEQRTNGDDAARILRSVEYEVEIRSNGNPDFAKAAKESAIGRNRTSGSFDGLNEYTGGTMVYYVGDQSDSFITSRCYNPINPVYFCEYTFVITDGLTGYVSFSDFRAHGGREYANRRVRFARDVVCRFLTQC